MILAADGFQFAHPEGAMWFVAAVSCALLLAWLVVWRKRARTRLADDRMLARIAPGIASSRSTIRAVLVALAMFAIVPALMDPRAGVTVETVEQRGIDVVVVVDVSRSMLAEDASPSRLARAKQFASDLVEALGSDRVGLVEFAGVPSLRCPLTFNHRTFRTTLESLSPQATIRGGSLLGDAIRLATTSLGADGNGKAIVVLSDGEDMESEPVEAAGAAAKERGIRVVTIGIGDSKDGARIPVEVRGERKYLVHEGQEVWTKMDPTLLKKVADAGQGFFVEAGTGQADMVQLAQLLASGLETSTRERSDVSSKRPLFQLFAAVALLLLVAECLMLPPARAAKDEATA